MMRDVTAVHGWLVAGAQGAATSPEVFQRCCDELRAAGVPLDRAAAYVRTLHPLLSGRSFLWEPGRRVEVGELPREGRWSSDFLQSPVKVVQDSALPVRVRLADGTAGAVAYPICAELARQGFTDYHAAPIRFLDGTVHAVTFATRRPGGFEDGDVAALEHVLVPLARVAEILALRRTAANVLSAYVGRDAGAQVLAGKIHRGDFDTFRAVIWCSDLRDFTPLAQSVEPRLLIQTLNDLFACQVPAIEGLGGEVLKFMGDGLLAIFPIEDAAPAPHRLCDVALKAAAEARRALSALNETRAARGDSRIRFGLALHVGDIAYGNIGGAARQDFTCVGPAVNLAARLEGLTGKLDRPVVASAAFATLTSEPMVELGAFELKGFAEPQRVFAPSGGDTLTRW